MDILMWIIRGPIIDGQVLYWSNQDGWVNRSSATVFTQEERWALNIPFNLPLESIGWESV